jgi:hypothetical protein
LLHDLDRFDRVVGQGRFAELDREVLGLARRIVKSGGNNRKKFGIGHLENGDRGSGGGLEL